MHVELWQFTDPEGNSHHALTIEVYHQTLENSYPFRAEYVADAEVDPITQNEEQELSPVALITPSCYLFQECLDGRQLHADDRIRKNLNPALQHMVKSPKEAKEPKLKAACQKACIMNTQRHAVDNRYEDARHYMVQITSHRVSAYWDVGTHGSLFPIAVTLGLEHNQYVNLTRSTQLPVQEKLAFAQMAGPTLVMKAHEICLLANGLLFGQAHAKPKARPKAQPPRRSWRKA